MADAAEQKSGSSDRPPPQNATQVRCFTTNDVTAEAALNVVARGPEYMWTYLNDTCSPKIMVVRRMPTSQLPCRLPLPFNSYGDDRRTPRPGTGTQSIASTFPTRRYSTRHVSSEKVRRVPGKLTHLAGRPFKLRTQILTDSLG